MIKLKATWANTLNLLLTRTKMCSNGELPENWIRKKSNSRPDKTFYFNTETGKSQWLNPADEQKIEKPKSSCQTNKKSKEKSAKDRFRLSDRSKDCKFSLMILKILLPLSNFFFSSFV